MKNTAVKLCCFCSKKEFSWWLSISSQPPNVERPPIHGTSWLPLPQCPSLSRARKLAVIVRVPRRKVGRQFQFRNRVFGIAFNQQRFTQLVMGLGTLRIKANRGPQFLYRRLFAAHCEIRFA